MLVRIREATQRCSQKLQLTLEKETGEAAMEEAAHMEELAAYDTQAHVLEVQATLEEQAQFNSTQQLISAADKYFQESLAAAQLRTKEFKAMSIRETEETKQEVEALKKTLDQHLSKIRETFEKSTEDLKLQCERELKELEQSLELQERVSIHEVEESKNCHMNKLKAFNQEAISKLKGYFEEITRDNLQLVKKLRAENERTAADNKRLKKEIDYMAAQNAKIREPLQEQEALKARLKAQLRFAEKDRLVLRNLKRRNKEMEENIKNVRLQIRELEHQKKVIGRTIGQMQQSIRQLQEENSGASAAYGALLRLQATETLAKLESSFRQIQESQASAHFPPEASKAVCQMIQQAVADHSCCERDLRKELRRSIDAYNDMVAFMRHRLEELRVPQVYIKAELLPQPDEPAAAGELEPPAAPGASHEPSLAVSRQTSGQSSEETEEMEDKTDLEGLAGGAAQEPETTNLNCSAHPAGWLTTQPCAQGANNIYLKKATLQRFTNNAACISKYFP
ncbi:growth-arrest-specific protein 8, putative [Eimeria necatrix]|uniref:Growth-arrest-specific protein 8, putative n=1 Tax=Eimeria necatrix TaxID=51315 RepID=U6MTU1_9EIME|nr:growth-arrest-specific protein 8, putative [Eimeria necatrix]CDJ65889.1 growth-arrest-specific protein 8, putative [Eimeria necatrix]